MKIIIFIAKMAQRKPCHFLYFIFRKLLLHVHKLDIEDQC